MKQSFVLKLSGLLFIALLLIAFEWWYGPIPQPLTYNNFADQRTFFTMPNFFNVSSNLAFLIIGFYAFIGLLVSRQSPIKFVNRSEIIFYLVFFIAVIFISLGSGYYHWSPNDVTLQWDRFPMTISFVSFFAAMIAERISCRWGLLLLPLFIVLGILSVIYWEWTLQTGPGDLRFYLFILFYPIFALPLLLLMFKSPYTHTVWLWISLALYIIARLFEMWDLNIFVWSREIISGHSLKHIMAALSTLCIWLYLIYRNYY